MAIDPFLFDTYKQYKAGTDKVTTWLANRAREMNTFDDLFPSEAASAKGKGRLKGKARAAQIAAGKGRTKILQTTRSKRCSGAGLKPKAPAFHWNTP